MWSETLNDLVSFAVDQYYNFNDPDKIPPSILISFVDYILSRYVNLQFSDQHSPFPYYTASFTLSSERDFLTFLNTHYLNPASLNVQNAEIVDKSISNPDSRIILLEKIIMLRAKIEKLKDEYSISTNPEVGSNSKNTNFANESESTKKYSEEEVENGIKQAVMTIHLAYSELFNNGVEDDEKLRIAEQCVAHISNEVSLWYTRFAGDSNGTPTVDENDESYSTNVELRRTVELHYQASQTIIPSIPQIQLCLTELQARVVDTVTDGGLKEKRRGVNKRIDEVVGKLDGYKNFVVVVDKLKSRN